jgi:hypothetical protein
LLLNSQIIKHYSINSYRLLQSGWFIKSESL